MGFRTDKLLHGGDYNPEQWLNRPDILAKDLDMLEESGCNVVSLGIFSWSTLEPEEGVFHFAWLKEIIDQLYQRESLRFWQHRPVPVRNGWQRNIRRCSAWMRPDTDSCLVFGTITAILLRYTEKKYIPSTKNWRRKWRYIRA